MAFCNFIHHTPILIMGMSFIPNQLTISSHSIFEGAKMNKKKFKKKTFFACFLKKIVYGKPAVWKRNHRTT